MKYISLILHYSFLLLFVAACSASTGTRYEKDNSSDENKINANPVNVEEDFDITPYKTKIEIEEPDERTEGFNDAWYEYESVSGEQFSELNNKIIGTDDGFRVLVIATDNMDEANSVRDNIYTQTSRKEVYISFEPPFYKVKVGDFTDVTEANNLKFKLSQLGYTEARVVQETVNIYEQ